MRILYTISGLGINSGGPSISSSLTVEGLVNLGLFVDALTYNISSEKDKNIIEGRNIHFITPPKDKRFLYSKEFDDYLKKHIDYDLYHCQGVWQYPTYITVRWARKQNKPYIITPRGMLYPQALQHSVWIKKMMLAMHLKKDLQNAACVHATCTEEKDHLRNLGIISPIAVIPNPIGEIKFSIIPQNDKHRIGYLGRVHPRKKIERLIYAWSNLDKKVTDKELVIIGGGDDQYLSFLKKEVNRLNLKNVIFTGFLTGKEKNKALLSLSYLAVPSDFENFGMIVPEALQLGIPVIASKGTPWDELNTNQCGWWVNNDIETLTEMMEQALNLPESERKAMGERGKQLIKEKYSVEVVAKQMSRLYDWILDGGEKPKFVYY